MTMLHTLIHHLGALILFENSPTFQRYLAQIIRQFESMEMEGKEVQVGFKLATYVCYNQYIVDGLKLNLMDRGI